MANLFKHDTIRRQVLVEGHVVPDPARCIQCGVCMFSCPVGIDIRKSSWRGEPVLDSRCITCGECVARCPRGALKIKRTPLFDAPES
ncbi:MAG TPA: 4Fe-4S binding protein [Anaerolineaceae bacterium]|jgi:NAD-dependent dihydropyrimidine dehydrogenase PreA subunit